MTEAITIAHFSFSVWLPTLVAKALATSFGALWGGGRGGRYTSQNRLMADGFGPLGRSDGQNKLRRSTTAGGDGARSRCPPHTRAASLSWRHCAVQTVKSRRRCSRGRPAAAAGTEAALEWPCGISKRTVGANSIGHHPSNDPCAGTGGGQLGLNLLAGRKAAGRNATTQLGHRWRPRRPDGDPRR
jgi:hypothetical protein